MNTTAVEPPVAEATTLAVTEPITITVAEPTATGIATQAVEPRRRLPTAPLALLGGLAVLQILWFALLWYLFDRYVL